MSDWKKKSENNFKASKYLIESELHNESVHCSYYSCVQFGFYFMHSVGGMEISDVEYESNGTVNGVGTHRWIKKQIFNTLAKSNKNTSTAVDRSTAVDINNDLGKLCLLRVKADYKYHNVGKKEAKGAIDKAEAILKVLKNNYDI